MSSVFFFLILRWKEKRSSSDVILIDTWTGWAKEHRDHQPEKFVNSCLDPFFFFCNRQFNLWNIYF